MCSLWKKKKKDFPSKSILTCPNKRSNLQHCPLHVSPQMHPVPCWVVYLRCYGSFPLWTLKTSPYSPLNKNLLKGCWWRAGGINELLKAPIRNQADLANNGLCTLLSLLPILASSFGTFSCLNSL